MAVQRRLQGGERRVGFDLLQRGQRGLAHAGVVVIHGFDQRRAAAAALGLAQPLRGFDPLGRPRILGQHVVQAFPRFVLGQLRQGFQSSGRGAGGFHLIQQPLQAGIPTFGIAGWIAVLIDCAEPDLPLFGDGDQRPAALFRFGLGVGIDQRQGAGVAADGHGARLAALIQRPYFQFAVLAQREQTARQRSVLLVIQRGAEDQGAHRALMGGIAAAVFLVNRAFQKANADGTIAATGHDAAIAGEGECIDAASAAGHDADFGLIEIGQRQDVKGVIGSGGGHAGAGGINRHRLQGLFAQAALGALAQVEFFTFGGDLVQLQYAILADAHDLLSDRRQRPHRAGVRRLPRVWRVAFAIGAPQRQRAIRRARQQQSLVAKRQRGGGGVQWRAESGVELGQLQQVDAGVADAHGITATAHGKEFAAGGDG